MRYIAVAETDIGIDKKINQDSILIKHAQCKNNEVLMAIVCDGMGGPSKGEIASATVVREFDKWFSKELLPELKNIDMNVIGGKWSLLLKELNIKIQKYGHKSRERLGTTFTGTLFVDNKFVIVHIGDTRMYYIDTSLKQLTDDHTYVAREVKRGKITLEQAMTDKRRNMLLQCVGASKTIEPQVICGEIKQGVYILCSDGFRHKVTDSEICNFLNFKHLKNKHKMHIQSRKLISLIKQRKEKDNISVIMIKSFQKNKIGLRENFFLIQKGKLLLIVILLIMSVLLLIYGIIKI